MRLVLTVFEFGALFLSLIYLLNVYSSYTGIDYDGGLTTASLLIYSGVWLLFLWLCGGYDKPWIPRKVLKGVGVGTLVLFAVYGLI